MTTSLHWWNRKKLSCRLSEHLRSIRNNTPGCPVAQHFNSTGHSISDFQVRGMALCSGTNIQRRQREMRLIFQLGTVQPNGLNINFSFIWIETLYMYTSYARYYMRACFDHFLWYLWYCAVLYRGFFSYRRRAKETETIDGVFLIAFDTFWYFLTKYHLISWSAIDLSSLKARSLIPYYPTFFFRK